MILQQIHSASHSEGEYRGEATAMVGGTVCVRLWGAELGAWNAPQNYVESFPVRNLEPAWSHDDIGPDATLRSYLTGMVIQAQRQPAKWVGRVEYGE